MHLEEQWDGPIPGIDKPDKPMDALIIRFIEFDREKGFLILNAEQVV